jgi:hypothetical protein
LDCKSLILLGLLVLCQNLTCLSQDSLQSKTIATKNTSPKPIKPEIFTSGFIDIMNNGQVNASARFIKLYIGEPGKFSIPISFYGGVSNNTFQNQTTQLVKSNDHLVNQYINPMSGLINISIDNVKYFTKKKEKVTKCGFVYLFGERLLNGIRIGPVSDTRTGKQVNFLNSFAAGGFIFQTGAWEKTETKNVGVFWLTMRYHICHTGTKQIREFLPDIETNGTYTGYSLGFGIEISNVVSMKAVYYKYTKAPEIDYGLPIYQFTFNYALKN